MLHRVALFALLVGACLAQYIDVVENDSLPEQDVYSEGETNDADVNQEVMPLVSVPSDETSAPSGRNSPGVHAGCGTCDITRCEPIISCIGGYSLDACGCCPACSRLVGDYCNSETVEEMRTSNNTNMIWYGRCGSDLECVTENAFVSGLLDGQPQQVKICECKKRGKVCGTDGITYPNICALKATAQAARPRNSGLQMRSTGSCPYGPIIVTKPRDVTLKVHETSNVMMCEASGYPIPAILWTFTRDDGTTVSIPSDDKDVSVITRGGQTENRVSSWVQIIGASKKHEGIYTCYAEISGTRAVQEDAQLTVSESD